MGAFIGEIFTLTVTVQTSRIVKAGAPVGDRSPSRRIFSGCVEIGVVWNKIDPESERE